MRNMSIRMKISIILVFVLAAFGYLFLRGFQDVEQINLDLLAEETVRNAQLTFETIEEFDVQKLGAALDALATREDFRDLYLAGDREGLYEYAQPLFEELKEEHSITHWYFERPPPVSNVFVRIHNADKYDDHLERITYLQAVETRERGVGKELGQTAFALRVVKPYYDAAGDLIGYMELGEEIDHFLETMGRQTGDEFAMFVLKDMLDEEQWASVRGVRGLVNNWDDYETLMLIDATREDEDIITEPDFQIADLEDGGMVLTMDEDLDEEGFSVLGAFPIYDAADEKVGVVIVEHDVTEIVGVFESTRTRFLWIWVVAGAVMTVLVVFLLDRLVFVRLNRMVGRLEEASTRLAGGDTDIEVTKPSAMDEIGRFEEFHGRFLSVVASILRQQGGSSER